MKNRILVFSLLFSVNLFAHVSSNFTVTSDYVWRGQTQTNNGAAVQGGMDYESHMGLNMGTWLSNVANLGTEADFYASYTRSFHENISLSLGGIFYHYTKSGASDSLEGNIGLNLWQFNLSANYMGDYLGSNSSSWYYTLSTSVDVWKKQNLALSLNVGLTTFDKEAKVGSEGYVDYKISLDRTAKEFTVSLFYTDTNRKTTDGVTSVDTKDDVFGVAASRSF